MVFLNKKKENHLFGQNCPKCAKVLSQVKIKNTCLLKYGVEHHSQCKEIHTKQIKYARKQYTFNNSNNIYYVQGYEPKALRLLESEGYNENDFCFKTKPSIWYFWSKDLGGDDKKHIYYPDFFIPKQNLIIEVKSGYTYDGNGKRKDWKNRNDLKRLACESLGYNYRLIII